MIVGLVLFCQCQCHVVYFNQNLTCAVKMYEPEIFAKNNQGTLNGTRTALEKIGHLIQWKPDNSDIILDIGCGPGNVLIDVVLPHFKGKYSKCYATDLSDKMIEFAQKRYGDREDVAFQQLDIMNVDALLAKAGPVDHVVSSFVLHWIPDLQGGLKNIFKSLKPGGDFFTVHCRESGVFDIYEYMDKNPKWNCYFDNLKQFVPSSHKSDQPEEDLRKQLTDCGFTEVVVESIPNKKRADNADALKVLFSSGFPQIHRIPSDKRKEYLEDSYNYGVEKQLITVEESGAVSLVFNLFIAYAKKPDSVK